MTDKPADQATLTKVVICTPGVSITVESHAPLATVTGAAERMHERAVSRYTDGPLPEGHGGIL